MFHVEDVSFYSGLDFLSDLLLLLPQRLNQLVDEESMLRGIFFVGCGSGEFLPAFRHDANTIICGLRKSVSQGTVPANKNGPIGIGPRVGM